MAVAHKGVEGLAAIADICVPIGADKLLWTDVEGRKVSVRVPVETSHPRGRRVTLVPAMGKASLSDAGTEARL